MIKHHHWQTLYLKPEDSQFLKVWSQSNLETWWICDQCQAIGRTTPNNKVRSIPARKCDRRREDARRWNDALKTWSQNQKAEAIMNQLRVQISQE